MINVLHTIDTTGPGGAETVFVDLAKGLDPRRFESFAAITGPGWVSDTLRNSGIEPIFAQSMGRFNFQYLLELVRIIRKYKIDIVQSHLLGANLYCSLAGLICRVPVVSTFHGFVDGSGKDRFMPIKSRIINLGSKKIVFVSDRLREHFIREYGFSEEKSVTIYNGVDTSIFQQQRDDSIRKELGLGPEHVLIGAIGNIRPAKGYEFFLKAARLVIDKHPGCRFVIAGEGSGKIYEGLLNLRKDLDLEGVFYFLGFRKDVSRILNNLNIFVLPSISEGFSISTIEAMMCKVPVIVTKSGGPEEIIQNNINGIYSEPGSETDLAKSMIMVINDTNLKNTIINNAFLQYENRFSKYVMLINYSNIYYNMTPESCQS